MGHYNIKLISFATPNFYLAQYNLIRSAQLYGIKKVHTLNQRLFESTSFYKQNLTITKQKRGAGYWLWKPFYIYQFLEKCSDDEILLYCDAGVRIVKELTPLLSIVSDDPRGVLLFENYQGSAYFSKSKYFTCSYEGLYIEPNLNKYWSKPDVFEALNFTSNDALDSKQVDGNIMLFRKTSFSLQFVSEWLTLCCNEQLLTDSVSLYSSKIPQTFFGHLHDQSIVSILAAQRGIKLYRCPSQFGNHFKLQQFREKDEFLLLPYSPFPKTNSTYGTLFLHTRERTMPFTFRIKSFFKLELKLIFANISLAIAKFKNKP